jgi:tRNA-(ms[2]io[6]A)-hydroxylase
VLNLASSTPPEWVEWIWPHFAVILLDHAHCEKKAAATAINLVFRYPEHPALVVPLSQLAREELEHFERVVAVIRARGAEFRRLTPSPYAARLMQGARTHEPARLWDTLLCCALIEARSCERMKLLAQGLPDAELRALYDDLLASEARHHTTYVDLARACGMPEPELRERLSTLAQHEASLLNPSPDLTPDLTRDPTGDPTQTSAPLEPRLHS